MSARLPRVELPELLLEIHQRTGFAHAFTHISEAQSRVEDLPVRKSDRPSGLTKAIGDLGRIAKTIHLLGCLDDGSCRRRILIQLNRGGGRHVVARRICRGQGGEIRKRYRDGQEEQLTALGLVTNAFVLWNRIYMEAALEQRRAEGFEVRPEDVARLSPLQISHIKAQVFVPMIVKPRPGRAPPAQGTAQPRQR